MCAQHDGQCPETHTPALLEKRTCPQSLGDGLSVTACWRVGMQCAISWSCHLLLSPAAQRQLLPPSKNGSDTCLCCGPPAKELTITCHTHIEGMANHTDAGASIRVQQDLNYTTLCILCTSRPIIGFYDRDRTLCVPDP